MNMKCYLRAGVAALALIGIAPAAAQTAAPAAGAPSESAMVNLVRALIAQGVLTEDRGAALIAQAEREAKDAQAKTAAQEGKSVAAGTIRVPYVPESVRQQIKDELRIEVLQAAQEEGWAKPGEVAEWPRRIRISGDLRVRDQFNFYDSGNATNIIDFATFNAIGPVDVNPSTNPGGIPILNSTQDRLNRFNYRARLAVDAKILDAVAVGFRFASGNDDGPVSTTQALGGGFNKDEFWIDRAFVKLTPLDGVSAILGRMPNPFYSTDLLYDEDLNFDGIAVTAESGQRLGPNFVLGGTVGAFPFEYGSSDFPAFDANKASDRNKWIFGGQLTGTWQARDDISLKGGVAYYDYTNVQGAPSEPCQLFGGNVSCSTDRDVPTFVSKGNTLFFPRNIVPPPGVINPSLPQFAALSFDYNLLNLTLEGSLRLNDRLSLTVAGDFVKNLAFDDSDICKLYGAFPGQPADPTTGQPAIPAQPERTLPPVNNVDFGCEQRVDDNGDPVRDPQYTGGDTAWMLRATVGYPRITTWGEWNLMFGYKYIESDSMLDSLTDSDFHLDGTNAEGFMFAGTLGLYDNVSARARWFSANEISGPRFSNDVLQIDLMVAF